MEKSMNKEELIELIESLKLDKNEFWILSSGAINEKIECVLDTKEPWKIEKVGEYNLQSIEKYYEFLKESNREKDKARIPLIEKYMKK